MKLRLELNVDKCVACGACVVACNDQNDIDVSEMSPFRRIADYEVRGENGTEFKYISVSCMHCDDPACVVGCPSACISKDPETDLTVYDNTNCIGCHSCSMACPVGAPSFRNGKMEKCDGCIVRIEHGYKPACVMACPSEALQLVEE